MPGADALPWSEKRTSLLKAMEKDGLQGGKDDSNGVGRHRHIHDPGIQQEPWMDTQLVPIVPGSLSTAQFDALSAIPPETKWFANLRNRNTRNNYKRDIQ